MINQNRIKTTLTGPSEGLQDVENSEQNYLSPSLPLFLSLRVDLLKTPVALQNLCTDITLASILSTTEHPVCSDRDNRPARW